MKEAMVIISVFSDLITEELYFNINTSFVNLFYGSVIFAYWVNSWEPAKAGPCVASAPKGQAVCGKGEEGYAISSPTSCRWHGISKW